MALPAVLARIAASGQAAKLLSYLKTGGIVASTVGTLEEVWSLVSGDSEIMATIYKWLVESSSDTEGSFDVEFGDFLLQNFNDPRVKQLVDEQRRRIAASRDGVSDIRESDQPLLAASNVESFLSKVIQLTGCRSREDAYALISIFRTIDLDDARLVVERDRLEKKKGRHGYQGQSLNWFAR